MTPPLDQLIRTVRNKRVILSPDLASIYGVSTKALNQAVRRNSERFPEDFAFQLTSEEFDFLRSQIVTLNQNLIVFGLLECSAGVSPASASPLLSSETPDSLKRPQKITNFEALALEKSCRSQQRHYLSRLSTLPHQTQTP